MDTSTTCVAGIQVFEQREEGEILILRFSRSKILDEAQIENIRICLGIAAEENRNMILDFSNVTFFSSAALSPLLALRENLCERGKKILFACMCKEVATIFAIVHCDTLELMEQNVKSAIGKMRSS
ncbi:MAG TPA: STAS domain-containing protein [Candidatus Peribacteraceae bacterium]|nr:STAS domain-containing protein [Candidatus Peribacteraceae bacterium]